MTILNKKNSISTQKNNLTKRYLVFFLTNIFLNIELLFTYKKLVSVNIFVIISSIKGKNINLHRG